MLLAVLDFATQLLLVGLGFFLVFSPHIISHNIHWGVAPTWSNFALAIPVAMIAYTGIETVSNLAEEARDPLRSVPRAISWVAIAVFAIYFTLPWVALSAMPVHKVGGEYVTQLGQDPPLGFKNDPVLGLVENLGLHGAVLSTAKIYVGILAATILLIATNAGVIGASRITYSMAVVPAAARGVPPAAPEAEDAVALARRLRRDRARRCSCCRGRSTSSAACTRSARCSRSRSRTSPSSRCARRRTEGDEQPWHARPNFRYRGVDWPLFAIFGGVRHRPGVARRRDPATEYALCGPRLARGRLHLLRPLPALARRSRCARPCARPS